jgi:hypothetical protein
MLSCSAPPHHCAFTARRSLSHAACRGQPAVGPTAERRLWTSFPHGCWHGDRRSTTTTASLRPGCRARRPLPREPADSNRTLRATGCRVGAGCCPAHVHRIRDPFHRALPPSPQAALYGSSGAQHAGHLSAQRETAAASAPRPGLDHTADRSCISARRGVPGGATTATAALAWCLSLHPRILFACTGGCSPASAFYNPNFEDTPLVQLAAAG